MGSIRIRNKLFRIHNTGFNTSDESTLFFFFMQMNRVDTCLKRGGVLSWGLAGNGGQGASSKPGVHMHRGGLLRTTR